MIPIPRDERMQRLERRLEGIPARFGRRVIDRVVLVMGGGNLLYDNGAGTIIRGLYGPGYASYLAVPTATPISIDVACANGLSAGYRPSYPGDTSTLVWVASGFITPAGYFLDAQMSVPKGQSFFSKRTVPFNVGGDPLAPSMVYLVETA